MIRDFMRRLTGRGNPVPQSAWEQQFTQGAWEYLQHVDELARYSVIAGYVQYFKAGGSLLDIGCGVGLLPARLGGEAYSCYRGIDLAHTAIQQAASRSDARTQFVQADASTYVPTQACDTIVFNEILYYFAQPATIVRRYETYLARDGIFIISMMTTTRTASIWRNLQRHFSVLDQTKVVNQHGFGWRIKVLSQGAPPVDAAPV